MTPVCVCDKCGKQLPVPKVIRVLRNARNKAVATALKVARNTINLATKKAVEKGMIVCVNQVT